MSTWKMFTKKSTLSIPASVVKLSNKPVLSSSTYSKQPICVLKKFYLFALSYNPEVAVVKIMFFFCSGVQLFISLV